MRIIMTGATSGIGHAAALRLIEAGHELVIGARNPDRAPGALAHRATLVPLDLADLGSVERFAGAVAGGSFDALVLNAGTQVLGGERSAQGFELTFAANHLAHFLLLRRLIGGAASAARVILTSSGTHDPALRTGMPAPRHADAQRLAWPERDPQRDARAGTAGRRAYSSSKLANLMTVLELARRVARDPRGITAMAFDPGFTPGTGLARSYPAPLALLFRRVLPLVARGAGVSTIAASGAGLAELVTAPQFADANGGYFAMRNHTLTPFAPSELARDARACARLWADTEDLLAGAGFAPPPLPTPA